MKQRVLKAAEDFLAGKGHEVIQIDESEVVCGVIVSRKDDDLHITSVQLVDEHVTEAPRIGLGKYAVNYLISNDCPNGQSVIFNDFQLIYCGDNKGFVQFHANVNASGREQ